MELRQLRYFCAVAEEEHLTRAAERLGIRATSLSQQIIALEKLIGTPLFTRTPAGMTPTAAGRALLPKAYVVLEAVEEALRAAREPDAPVLRIGVTPGAPPPAVSALGRLGARRGSTVDLRDLPVSRQLERLRAGGLDAGLVVLPADTTGLAEAVISDVPLGILMAQGHPLTRRDTVDWPDLGGQDLLWFDRELAPGYHDHVLAACADAGWRPRIRAGSPRRGLFTAELESGEAVVALRPRWAARDGDLVWRELSGAPRLRHALVWRIPQHGPVFAGLAAELADEARAHTDEAPPRGQR
ncbi:LysR family transcriptional regulator [Amycolatopsis sp. NPDC059027]|uniref:LysR family transcriptional regulator n=1 Tax=unclassified Amycolatopsis TaxID=2618356 RepID=UPI00366C3A1C